MKPSNEVTDALTDEFTDTVLSTPKREKNLKESLIKLPSATVVANTENSEEEAVMNSTSSMVTNTLNSEEETLINSTSTKAQEELKLPPGLVISPAQPGMVKLQAGALPSPAMESKVIEVGGSMTDITTQPETETKNVIELGSPKTEILPSPASDATTSTRTQSRLVSQPQSHPRVRSLTLRGLLRGTRQPTTPRGKTRRPAR